MGLRGPSLSDDRGRSESVRQLHSLHPQIRQQASQLLRPAPEGTHYSRVQFSSGRPTYFGQLVVGFEREGGSKQGLPNLADVGAAEVNRPTAVRRRGQRGCRLDGVVRESFGAS
jgi:hypothetical protein